MPTSNRVKLVFWILSIYTMNFSIDTLVEYTNNGVVLPLIIAISAIVIIDPTLEWFTYNVVKLVLLSIHLCRVRLKLLS